MRVIVLVAGSYYRLDDYWPKAAYPGDVIDIPGGSYAFRLLDDGKVERADEDAGPHEAQTLYGGGERT